MDYVVKLELFEGPLDLLLYLIHKNELDIFDIPISTITEQFLDYLEAAQAQGLGLNPDFLFMASVLLHIKSMMLLKEKGQEEEEDPRAEITRPLLEYMLYKEAGQALDRMELLYRDVFPRRPGDAIREFVEGMEKEMEVDLSRLMDAFKRLVRPERTEGILLTPPRWTIREKIDELLKFKNKGHVSIRAIFEISSCIEEFVVFFVAVLELIFNGIANIEDIEGDPGIVFNGS